MKSIATAFAAIVLTLGAATQVQAREYCDEGYRTTIVITGRDRCGAPVYAERFFVRISRHGNPVWGYRPVAFEGRDRRCEDRRFERDPRGDGYERAGYDYRDQGRHRDGRYITDYRGNCR